MKNILSIDIQKSKDQFIFLHENKPLTIETILEVVHASKVRLLHIQTFENGKRLLNCYIPTRTNKQISYRLARAGKAQI